MMSFELVRGLWEHVTTCSKDVHYNDNNNKVIYSAPYILRSKRHITYINKKEIKKNLS